MRVYEMLQETAISTQGNSGQRGMGSPLQQLSQYIVNPHKMIDITAYLLERNIYAAQLHSKRKAVLMQKELKV